MHQSEQPPIKWSKFPVSDVSKREAKENREEKENKNLQIRQTNKLNRSRKLSNPKAQ